MLSLDVSWSLLDLHVPGHHLRCFDLCSRLFLCAGEAPAYVYAYCFGLIAFQRTQFTEIGET